MSDQPETETDNNDLPAALTLSVKLGRTVNRGNYENDRYDVFIPVPYTPGQPIQPALATAFAEARAELQRQEAYDVWLREMYGKIEHRNYTVEQWGELIDVVLLKKDVDWRDGERLLELLYDKQEERRARDEEARKVEEARRTTAEDIIKAAQLYLDSNPIPTPQEMYKGVDSWSEPPYYLELGKAIRAVVGYDQLPSHVQRNLSYTSVGALVAATTDEVLKGQLPQRPERPDEDEVELDDQYDDEGDGDQTPDHLNDDSF